MPNTAVVFAGVPVAPTPRLRARLAQLDQPFVIAADSGAATALAFGLRPDVLIGDFDSLAAESLRELEASGVQVERFPVAKDATDGELALLRAAQSAPARLVLVGFLNGLRFDQTVANLMLAAHYDAVLVDAHNESVVLEGPTRREWRAEPDEIISLVPLTNVVGVTTSEMRYPLRHEDLPLGTTRGVSNEPASHDVAVEWERGSLLVNRHFPSG